MKSDTLLFVGAPGSGKGTRINLCEGYAHISSGDLLRAARYNLSSGEFVSDNIVLPMVLEAISSISGNKILDGYPRHIGQAEKLEELGIIIDKVFYIEITDYELPVRRALNRLTCTNPNCQSIFTKDSFKPPKIEGICDDCGDLLGTRVDDNERTIRRRLELFRERTLPLVEYYKKKGYDVITLNPNTSPPEDILKYI